MYLIEQNAFRIFDVLSRTWDVERDVLGVGFKIERDPSEDLLKDRAVGMTKRPFALQISNVVAIGDEALINIRHDLDLLTSPERRSPLTHDTSGITLG
jgi:hypothetical protein